MHRNRRPVHIVDHRGTTQIWFMVNFMTNGQSIDQPISIDAIDLSSAVARFADEITRQLRQVNSVHNKANDSTREIVRTCIRVNLMAIEQHLCYLSISMDSEQVFYASPSCTASLHFVTFQCRGWFLAQMCPLLYLRCCAEVHMKH